MLYLFSIFMIITIIFKNIYFLFFLLLKQLMDEGLGHMNGASKCLRHGIYGLYAYMSSTFLTFLLLTIYVCREKTFLLITHA